MRSQKPCDKNTVKQGRRVYCHFTQIYSLVITADMVLNTILDTAIHGELMNIFLIRSTVFRFQNGFVVSYDIIVC